MTQLSSQESLRPFTSLTPEQEAELRRSQQLNRYHSDYLDEAVAARRVIGIGGSLLHRIGRLSEKADPTFRVTPELLDEYSEGLPDEWNDEYLGAVSLSDMNRIRKRLLTVQRDRETLSDAGIRGIGLQLFAGLTDPTEVALQVGANALVPGSGIIARAGGAAKTASATRRAIQAGLIFAGTDAAIMAAHEGIDSTVDYSVYEYGFATLASFTLGGALEYRALRKVEQQAARIAPEIIPPADGFAVGSAFDVDDINVAKAMEILNAETARRLDPVVARNLAEWEKQFEIPAPIARMSDGTLVYGSREQADAAAEALNRKVDRAHIGDHFQQQNIPAEFRTSKPTVEVQPMLGGAGHSVRVLRDGSPIDTMPYVAGTAEQRLRLLERQHSTSKLTRDLEFDMLRNEAGDLRVVLTDKGKRYFASQLEEAALTDEEWIELGARRLTTEEIQALIDEAGPSFTPPPAQRGMGPGTPTAGEMDLISERNIRTADEIAERSESKGINDFDAGWARGAYIAPAKGGTFGMAGTTGRSPSEATRRLSRISVEHVREDVDGNATRIGASEFRRRETLRIMGEFSQKNDEAWRQWAKAKNVHWYNRGARELFEREVYLTVKTASAATGDAALDAIVAQHRKFYADWLERAKRLKIPGFENVPADPHYIPRIFRKQLIDKMVAEIGQEQTVELILGSLFSGHPLVAPTQLTRALRRTSRAVERLERKIAARAKGDAKILATLTGDELNARLAKRLKTDQAMAKRLADLQTRRAAREAALAAAPRVPLDPKLARRIAKGYYDRLQRIGEIQPASLHALFNSDTRSALAANLRELVENITEDEIESVLGALRRTSGESDAGKTSRAMRRLQLNDDYQHPTLKWKDGSPIRFDDLVEKNGTRIAESYNSDMLGAIVMDEILHAMTPPGATPFRTKQQLIDFIADDMRQAGVPERGLPWQQTVQGTLDKFDGIFRHLEGRPMTEGGVITNTLATIATNYNIARLMGRSGIAQAGELGGQFAENGLASTLQASTGLREMIQLARTGKFTDELAIEIQAMIGTGQERWLTDFTARLSGAVTEEAGGTLAELTKMGARAALKAGGMTDLDAALRVMHARGMLHRWAKTAHKGRIPSAAHLRRMGIDESMAKRIRDQIIAPGGSVTDPGVLGWKMKRLNIDSWTDKEAASVFVNAIDRTSRRNVQQNDIGQMALWMTTPMGRIITQFRAFPLVAWEKQVLYQLDMHDTRSAIWLMYTQGSGALSYLAVTHLNAAGKDPKEREKYLKERTSLSAIAAGAWQRSAASSLIPGVIDSAMSGFGQKPIFAQGRTTGLAADLGLSGNPTSQLGKNMRALSLLRAPFDPGFEATQADFRAFRNLIPLQNAYGIQQILDRLQSRFPDRREED